MKLHIFYKKYADLPMVNKHVTRMGTRIHEFKDSRSPYELYLEIKRLDDLITDAKMKQEQLLKIADSVLLIN